MRGVVVGATIAMMSVVGLGPGAWADCGGAHGVTAQSDQARAPREIVVNAPEPAPGARGPEVVVKGSTGQTVRVVAPPSGSATAIGGDGAPGQAGAPGR